MKLKQIAEQSDKELQKLIETTRIELSDAIVELRTQKAPNVKRIKAVKKTIAMALTISRQRELTGLAQAESNKAADSKPIKRGESNG